MAEIVVARHAGACYGVERALDLVEEALASGEAPVRTLGPLIHNPLVVEGLERRGCRVCSEVPADGAGTLVLRTHGVLPDVERRARESGLAVVDATCPYVTKTHVAARRLADEGYQVLVVGEAGHPEVDATAAHAPGSVVVGGVCDLEGLALSRRVGVVVQTTQSRRLLEEVVSWLVGRVEELRVCNTICSATDERQRAAAELAGGVDAMVVIGGRNSANTTRLAEICAGRCPGTHHVEDASELEAAWFAGAARVGVTAGASTPASQIAACVDAIEALAG